MNSKKASNSGGSAAHIGIGYQNRVAAWFCVQMLAEKDVSPLWQWPAHSAIEYVRCETGQPIDDIMIGAFHGKAAYINVKHSVTANEPSNSELASVLNQFTQQYIKNIPQAEGANAKEHVQGHTLDRLVLITSSKGNSSNSITRILPQILKRLRTDLVAQKLGLDDAAQTVKEQGILAKVKAHLQREWFNATSLAPTESEIINFLRLFYVQVLDVEEDGGHEREAKNILRTSILRNRDQADLAWNSLINICTLWSADRSGGSRKDLEQQLSQVGISLNAPSSFQADIAMLKKHSERTFDLLRTHSQININDQVIKVQRSVSPALHQAAEQQSLVVVGEPGSGKSGVLHDLVERAKKECDVIFLAVDRLEVKSLGDLQNALHLEHEFVEILCNWKGCQGILVLDALDAARSGIAAQVFYDLLALIKEKAKHWHVVASIREYDLRHNPKLKTLFSGQPHNEYRSQEFLFLRHFYISRLNTEEWLQLASQSPELGQLFLKVDSRLRDLLFIPFNVRLAATLLERGVLIERLTPIKTQIELLNLYWEERVDHPNKEKYARKILLTNAVNEMVRTRLLRVSSHLIATTTEAGTVLESLLTSNVLSEWVDDTGTVDDAIIAFSHHVLFDYAVERLMLRVEAQKFIKILKDDPDLNIAIRPSLVMHLENEWARNRNTFWQLVFSIAGALDLPEIGKLIGASVAVQAATDIGDFLPLIQALNSPKQATQECAEKVYRHVIGAILAKDISSEFIVGATAFNWAALFNQATAVPRKSTIYSAGAILQFLCNQAGEMTDAQRKEAGIVARRMLDFALNQPARDLWLVIGGLETVCRTYESEPEASREILRRCLEPKHVIEYGHEELFQLAQELERLIQLDPQLVEEIYCAAFTLMDDSDEKTSMGGSRIMSLTSTRRQDFHLARFSLAEKFSKFMHHAPEYALRALIAAFRTYPSDRYSYSRIATAQTESFDFNGQQARLKLDRSEMWADNGGSGNHEEPLKMLNIFEHFLEQIAADSHKAHTRKKLIDLLVSENETAALWRKVLQVAEKHPQTLGLEIQPLAWAIPIFTCDDTSQPMGAYLKAAFPYFASTDRSRVEQAILSLSELVNEEGRRYAERVRNRLLGCLDEQSIVREGARTLLLKLKQSEAVPANEPRFHPPVFSSRPFTDEDWLRDNNISVEDTANRHLLNLFEPVKVFASNHFNGCPTLASVHEIIPALQSLHAALRGLESENYHEQTRNLAWGHLADACEKVTRCEKYFCEDENTLFIAVTLIEATRYPDPPATEYQDWEGNSWGSPAARIDAAEGIMRLAEKTSCVNEELLDVIERLANDPTSPVRYMIARSLTRLYHTAPALMWKLLDKFSQTENNRGVLRSIVADPLSELASYHPDRIVPLVRQIFDRVRGDAQFTEARQRCVNIFTGLYIWHNQPVCKETVQMIANNPAEFSIEAHGIAFDLRAHLNLGSIESPDVEQDQVRLKSFDLLQRLLASTLNQTKELELRYKKELPFSSWSELDQKKASDLAHLVDSIGMQIYFASGAYQDNDSEESVPRGTPERTRFWQEARPTLELLAEFGDARVVHHLIQTLEYLLPFAPLEVFLLIGKVLKKGKEGGYQYESMAIPLIVKIVERFIAEYR